MPKTRPRYATPSQVRVLNLKKAGNLTLSHETAVTIVASDGRGHAASNGRGHAGLGWQDMARMGMASSAQTSSQPKISHSYNSTNMASNTTMENGQALINCLITIAFHRSLQSYSIPLVLPSTTKYYQVPSTTKYYSIPRIYIHPRSRQPLINSSQTNQHTDQTTPETIVQMGGGKWLVALLPRIQTIKEAP